MSYSLDVYMGRAKVQKNPLNVVLYVSFFPQLVAGPIVRYQTIADQIETRRETFDDFSEGVRRFILGFTKKIILSNNMALVADAVFGDPNRSVVYAWMGAIAYTFQIFFDFSGYSDMAIGLGKMFGFHFLENFDYPYISAVVPGLCLLPPGWFPCQNEAQTGAESVCCVGTDRYLARCQLEFCILGHAVFLPADF